MKRTKTLFLLGIAALCLGGATAVHGASWNAKSVLKDLFSDKTILNPAKTNKGAAADKETPVQPPTEKQLIDMQRGHARETRPDIPLPPMPDAAPSPAQQELPPLSLNEMLQREAFPSPAFRPADAAKKVRWIPPPSGFLTAETFNYLIYRETYPVTTNIRNILENIHTNLMFDLTPFSILLKPNKILVMLFDQRHSYAQFTQLPSWSGASSDLRSDTMFVLETNSFYALSVHELTHLYFDGYFLPTISPLWLSEGMAVHMQLEASKQRPAWIEEGFRRILGGETIPFEEMTQIDTLNNYSTAQAELWYTQAYSTVHYLLTQHTRDEFYKFCNELKAKTPLYQALYRAYGMPFNKVSVLENVWLHYLKKEHQNGRVLQPALRQPTISATPSTAISARPPTSIKQQSAAPALPPRPKPVRRTTPINKLQMVPTNGYKGGF